MHGNQKPPPSWESFGGGIPDTKVKQGNLAYATLASVYRKWKSGLFFFGLLCLSLFLASEMGSRSELILEHGALSFVGHLTIAFFIVLVLVPQMVVSGS